MKMSSNRTNSNGVVLPRWAVPIVWAVIVLVIQGLSPWAISNVGPRFGWNDGMAGTYNLVGLLIVAIGLSTYAYCLAFHFRSYTSSVSLSFSPPHLVRSGPYQFSRNPMYVSGLVTWIGWTIYFGSLADFIALSLLWLVFHLRVIPQEERLLEKLFGEEYLRYKRSVRRWAGRF